MEHVGGRRRNKGKKTKKLIFPVTHPGEEEKETMPLKNDTVSFYFFFSEE
jgi:hypothetical protein